MAKIGFRSKTVPPKIVLIFTFDLFELVGGGLVDPVVHDSVLVKLDLVDLDSVILFLFTFEFKVTAFVVIVLQSKEKII